MSEAVSPEAAERMTPMKKPDMADAAEQLVGGTGWLPAIMRMPEPEPEPEAVEAEQAADFETSDAVDAEAVADKQPFEAETQDSDAPNIRSPPNRRRAGTAPAVPAIISSRKVFDRALLRAKPG